MRAVRDLRAMCLASRVIAQLPVFCAYYGQQKTKDWAHSALQPAVFLLSRHLSMPGISVGLRKTVAGSFQENLGPMPAYTGAETLTSDPTSSVAFHEWP